MAEPTMPPLAKSRAPKRSDRIARDRSGDEQSSGERKNGDACPQRGALEGVAVQRQPDALEPDDQDEHQATATQRSQQTGEQACAERSDLEQVQAGTWARRPASR